MSRTSFLSWLTSFALHFALFSVFAGIEPVSVSLSAGHAVGDSDRIDTRNPEKSEPTAHAPLVIEASWTSVRETELAPEDTISESSLDHAVPLPPDAHPFKDLLKAPQANEPRVQRQLASISPIGLSLRSTSELLNPRPNFRVYTDEQAARQTKQALKDQQKPDPGRHSPPPARMTPANPPPRLQFRGSATAGTQADQPVRYRDNPPPHYPTEAIRLGLEGRVLLRVSLDEHGKVRNAELGQSSGHEILDKAAIKAVSQWRFQPARSSGQPIAMVVEVPIRFRLKR